MAQKSKKGGQFERDISKLLSLWWSEGKRDDIFWRSSQSGGRATIRAKSGKKTAGSYGDLTNLHESGKPFIDYFCCELKRGYTKDTDALALIDSKQKCPLLLKHWMQCDRDRELANRKENLVILKRDCMKPCIIISHRFMQILKTHFGTPSFNFLTYLSTELIINIMQLPDFLNWVDPKTLKLIVLEDL